jgi:hypothetical protein
MGRGDVDDPTPTLLFHLGHRRSNGVERGRQIDVEDCIPLDSRKSCTGAVNWMPALFTRISRRPNFSTIATVNWARLLPLKYWRRRRRRARCAHVRYHWDCLDLAGITEAVQDQVGAEPG